LAEGEENDFSSSGSLISIVLRAALYTGSYESGSLANPDLVP
jgi:hypothetical protein